MWWRFSWVIFSVRWPLVVLILSHAYQFMTSAGLIPISNQSSRCALVEFTFLQRLLTFSLVFASHLLDIFIILHCFLSCILFGTFHRIGLRLFLRLLAGAFDHFVTALPFLILCFNLKNDIYFEPGGFGLTSLAFLNWWYWRVFSMFAVRQ